MKKLSKLLFVFFILFTFATYFNQTSNQAYALTQDCMGFTNEVNLQNPVLKTANRFDVNIKLSDQYASGKQLGVRIEVNGFDRHSTPHRHTKETTLTVPEGGNRNFTINTDGIGMEAQRVDNVYVFFYDLGDRRSGCVFREMKLTTSDESGNTDTNPPAGGNPSESSCRIVATPGLNVGDELTNLTPDGGIFIKVENLNFTDPNGEKGWRLFSETAGGQVRHGCFTNQQLANGVRIPTYNGYKVDEGTYTVSVNSQCFDLFGTKTPDGAPICNSPYQVVVSKDGGAIFETCTTDYDQSKVSNECRRKAGGEFIYCVEDPKTQDYRTGICSKTPGIARACNNGICKTTFGNFNYIPAAFAQRVLSLLLGLAGGILLAFLIISGYKLMTSQGNPDKIKEARESITSAVAGLLLIIFSLAILQLITVDILALPGFGR
jgi:hypothetical protein